MSAQNRTALKALVAAWAATLDLEDTHKPTEQHILDSVLLNRDVKNVVSVTDLTYEVDFTGYDTVTLNVSNDVTCTFTGFVEGESKYLVVNKTVGDIFAISGIADASLSPSYTTDLALLFYRIIYKGGAVIAEPIHASFNYDDIPAPETAGAWQQLSPSSPWLENSDNVSMRAGIWYRVNRGFLEVDINVVRSLSYSALLGTLPSGYRPAYGKNVCVYNNADSGYVNVGTNGQLNYYAVTPATFIVASLIIGL